MSAITSTRLCLLRPKVYDSSLVERLSNYKTVEDCDKKEMIDLVQSSEVEDLWRAMGGRSGDLLMEYHSLTYGKMTNKLFNICGIALIKSDDVISGDYYRKFKRSAEELEVLPGLKGYTIVIRDDRR